ncbi:MAG TPA: HTH domain-containing protein [Candidatus Baltobacteraceae bacterium]|jgi:DNA-binding transcriptional ArsR family regulator
MIDVNMSTMGKPRAPGLPAPAMRRKISVLVQLVRRRRVSLRLLRDAFAVSERTVLRDLQELREIGKVEGFAIGERDGAGMVSLTEF